MSNREVVLGVTGSIAAYKACEIASSLVKLGARVTPVLTQSAQELVRPATFEAITGQRAILHMFEPFQNSDVEHIAVATRADLFLIAPATANILAKAARGVADDWLSTTLLATRAPILFAPAMNTNMYTHPATQQNIQILRERGCRFVGPSAGRLACNTIGVGRMIDPPLVVEAALPLLDARKDFEGRRVVITSGGTREPIDPVRFIGNRSSGKMGRALTMEALARKANVTLVTANAETDPPAAAEVIEVETAREMQDALMARLHGADVVIGAAAVADYRAEQQSPTKHKRSGDSLTLALVENPDIIAGAARERQPGQVMVGFAAETDNLLEQGQKKLHAKGLDLILANAVGADSGFGADSLEAALIGRDGVTELGSLSKEEVAEKLFDRIASLLPDAG